MGKRWPPLRVESPQCAVCGWVVRYRTLTRASPAASFIILALGSESKILDSRLFSYLDTQISSDQARFVGCWQSMLAPASAISSLYYGIRSMT